MCDLDGHGDEALPALAEDEYALDTRVVREFIGEVRALIATSTSPQAACAALRPGFERLLAARHWLPHRFQQRVPHSGMGGGIGQWLLYRAADRSLCMFSLVVPPGATTPIHDHLAWGLIGLYRGNQDEELYRPGHGTIECTRRRPLAPGDHYVLLPPRDDIHRVRTTSAQTSVSIHLLANDTGCTRRHTFDELTGEAAAFLSGYANAQCTAAPT